MQHLNSSPPSCWFTSHSTFNNFMLKSIVSQNMANPSTFPLPNRVQYLPIFVYSPENFIFSNFIKPADLFHIHISKASIGSFWTIVACWSCFPTCSLHTKPTIPRRQQLLKLWLTYSRRLMVVTWQCWCFWTSLPHSTQSTTPFCCSA